MASLVVLYALSLPLSLTFSWVVLVIALCLGAVIIAFALKFEPESVLGFARALPPFVGAVAGFVVVVAASGLFAGGVGEAWRSAWSLKGLVVYFWAFACFFFKRQLVFLSLEILLTVAATSGFWSAIQQLTGFHPLNYPYLQGTGFLSAPMAFAGQMQLFSLLAVGLWLKPGKLSAALFLRGKPLFTLVVAGNLAGVIFASERSAWLGAICGAIAITALISWKTVVKCLIALALILCLGWATVPVVKQRLVPLANWQQDISTRVRIQLWKDSLSLWARSPLLGLGMCRYPQFDIPEAIVPGRSQYITHAHSNYVQILTTVGVAGLVSYLIIWAFVLRHAFLCYQSALIDQKGNDALLESGLALGVLGGVVALMVSGLFEYNFGAAQVRLAQWFVLAMLPGLARQNP